MRLVVVALLAAFLAYFLGRGHEFRAWERACEWPDDDTDWLDQSDTYTAALMRRITEVTQR